MITISNYTILLTVLIKKSNGSSLFLMMIHDANRFILSYRSIIEKAPLQLYYSALIFSPKKSEIRRNFWDQIPSWVINLPIVEEHWNSSLQVLEGHSSRATTLAFSPEGQL